MLKPNFTPTFAAALLATGFLLHAEELPRLTALHDGSAEVTVNGAPVALTPGNHADRWTFMGTVPGDDGKPCAIFEDFSSMQESAGMLVLNLEGRAERLPKSLEATFADPKSLYRRHTYQEVADSDHDLLGAEVLALPEDPSFERVAGCFPPITRMETYAFVGTPENSDKIGVEYGGRTANFDPAAYVPYIRKIRKWGKVYDGLVGGWQPILRFVYPEKAGTWSELVLFAPRRVDNGNTRIQPVWYRVCRIEGNELKWAKYFDSYHPFPPRGEAAAAAFYGDLLAMRESWQRALAPGMKLDLPDHRLADLARHSLVRAMITRMGAFPKYGVLDRNYGGAEHDGFLDTFNVDTTAMLEWGLFDLAGQYLDNYLTYFVRDDGSILYRGPETGQYGRMLTVLAQYTAYTGDAALLLKHRARIEAVTRVLLALRKTAQALPRESAAYGMIAGWSEADACLDPEPARYMQPYFSNSSEAARGFSDLGAVWEKIGREKTLEELVNWGSRLRREAKELEADMQTAMGRSILHDTEPPCLPTIAGVKVPFNVAVPRDGADPQARAYRANMEMFFSGNLTREEVEMIVKYREAHRDILLGVPAAYGYSSREMGGFLSYGHAFGLLQHDYIRPYLLELYSLSAHQYTRGTWTAPETRKINPADGAAAYCVPAQLSVPLLVRWMLAFEDPADGTLWLCKAVPRDWLEDGKRIAVSDLPTRWGRVGFQITSHLAEGRIEVELELPPRPSAHETKVRLRVPGARRVKEVKLGDGAVAAIDTATETITLPASACGKISLTVRY